MLEGNITTSEKSRHWRSTESAAFAGRATSRDFGLAIHMPSMGTGKELLSVTMMLMLRMVLPCTDPHSVDTVLHLRPPFSLHKPAGLQGVT